MTYSDFQNRIKQYTTSLFKHPHLLTFFAFIILFLFSTYKLNYPYYIGDEIDLAFYAKNMAIKHEWRPSSLTPENNLVIHGALYGLPGIGKEYRPEIQSWGPYYILKIGYMLVPDLSPFFARLIFVIFGLAGLYILLAIFKRFLTQKRALLGILVIGLSGFYLASIRGLRYYSLVLFFSTYFFYYFIDIINTKKKIHRKDLIHIFISLCGIHFSHYLNYIVLIIPCIIYTIFFINDKHTKTRLFLPLLGSLIIAGADIMLNHLGYVQTILSGYSLDHSTLFERFSYKILIFALPCAIYFLIKKDKKKLSALSTFYLVMFTIAMVILNYLHAANDFRYYYVILIAFFIYFAQEYTIIEKKSWFVALVIVLFSYSYLFPSVPLAIFTTQFSNPQRYTQFYQTIKRTITDPTKTILCPNNSVLMWLYTLDDKEYHNVGQIDSRMKTFFSNFPKKYFDDYQGVDYIIGTFCNQIQIDIDDKTNDPQTFSYHSNTYKKIYFYSEKIPYPFYVNIYRKLKYKITGKKELLNDSNVLADYIYMKI